MDVHPRGRPDSPTGHYLPVLPYRSTDGSNLVDCRAALLAHSPDGGRGGAQKTDWSSLAMATCEKQILHNNGFGVFRRVRDGQRTVDLAAASPQVIRAYQPSD